MIHSSKCTSPRVSKGDTLESNISPFLARALVYIFPLLVLTVSVSAQLGIQAIDVTGDSISKGFNAGSAFPCSNGDQETFNWLTSDTHGTSYCTAGSENVFSILEQMECGAGASLTAPQPNHAASGATLVRDFMTQARSVNNYLSSQPTNRLAVVFLGHNDSCSGSIAKTNSSCSNGDLDPSNYCKTRPEAFERELRRGLDILMSIRSTRIGVIAPIRVSQLCNFGSKTNCQVGGSCQFLWGVVNICGSLTRDCSSVRIVDTYSTMKTYNDILKRVADEYAAIPEGGQSTITMVGGQIVGGGAKAPKTTIVYSAAPWFYKFSSAQISCCDCFHPSGLGQNTLAALIKNGLTCSTASPCCKDSDEPLSDGKCTTVATSRGFYQGIF